MKQIETLPLFLLLLTFCACGDPAGGERNRIMGTGEKTDILPISVDDRYLDAFRTNNAAAARELSLAGANGAARDALGSTALLLAVRHTDNLELARLALELATRNARGADPTQTYVNTPDTLGRTPLSWAAQNGRITLARFLLEKGAALDQADQARQTPLFHAALAGETRMAAFLLDRGANANVRDQFGDTPLMLAGAKGYRDLVRLLLAKGADRALKNQEGRTALDRAAESVKPLLQ